MIAYRIEETELPFKESYIHIEISQQRFVVSIKQADEFITGLDCNCVEDAINVALALDLPVAFN